MATIQNCPECGAVWQDGQMCQDTFNQMLAWDFEDPEGAGAVHYLTLLSYHLQHPSLYSLDGLKEAKQLLVDFLERGATIEQVRKRTFKFAGTTDSQGAYAPPSRGR